MNRLGNVLVPNSSYGVVLERKLTPMFKDILKGRTPYPPGSWWTRSARGSTTRIPWPTGATARTIPMFIPGITDGSFGSQLWMYWQDHRDLKIDLFQDEQDLMDMVFDAKESGALMIGGGISKHHTIWWNQFRGGLDHAVYLTTAVEYDGSLSGAQVREAVSWGKVKETPTT